MSPSERIAVLIAERHAADATMSLGRQRWEACNAELIELCSPHKVGDRVPFQKRGKTFTLLIGRIAISRNMVTDELRLNFLGQLVRRSDGGVSHKGDSFSIELKPVAA